jgi:UDP-N-acetylmuramoylalanine--D-glutamate ligase
MTPAASPGRSAETGWDKYRDDTFLIVGFTERTGRSVAQVFEERGLRYKVSDLRPREELDAVLAGLKIKDEDVFAGPQGPEQLAGITKIVLSPGVPRSIPLVQEAKRRDIAVLGDVDFFCDLVRPARIVAITGTDGKTTTTMLTGAVLAAGGRPGAGGGASEPGAAPSTAAGAPGSGAPTAGAPGFGGPMAAAEREAAPRAKVVVAGNVGDPVFARYHEILDCDYLVLELSSFMLEEIHAFRPNIAAITNVAEDHLDRYPTFDDYLRTKENIVRNCRPGDVFVQNLDDPALRAFHPKGLRVRTVSQRETTADCYFDDGQFHFAGETLTYADCLLRGDHNIENILIALAIGCEAGVDPAGAARAVREFAPVAHRFEYLGCLGGVDVYDDSKATTVHAVGHALESLPGGVVLIVGGRGKDLDFLPLKEHEAKIKLLMCYGEAGEQIRDRLAFERSDYVYGFAEAVKRAAAACVPGDVLLLSPGCTSWDQHTDYGVRGREFGELARQELGEPV